MDLEVAKGELERVRVVDQPAAELREGEIRVGVDAFALTSNNITYAVLGDMLNYWAFFPAAPTDPGDETDWGRIPAWGFGDVVESRSPDVDRRGATLRLPADVLGVVLAAGRADEQGISRRLAPIGPSSRAPTTATRGAPPIRTTGATGRPSRCCSRRSSSPPS